MDFEEMRNKYGIWADAIGSTDDPDSWEFWDEIEQQEIMKEYEEEEDHEF